MWNCLKRVLCLNSAFVFAIFLARTGASPAIVNGVLGHSVSLFPSIPVRQDVYEVEWIKSSPRTMIAQYSEGSIKYFNSSYNNRITLHSGNFSLEIHDLRKEDVDEYEVIVTAGDSGDERRERIQLKVYELVSGANITVQTTGICNLTLTCTMTSGDHTSFTWWRNGEASVNDSTQHIRVLGNTLEVSHTAEVEDAVYKCEARNPISNETAEIRLRDICKLNTYARTGASPAIVNGVLGHSVSLFPSIPVRQDMDEVVWKRSSPSTKIARYLEGSIKYFNSNYNNRITLHFGNFSLEIHDLRKEDADEYEVIVTAGDSGDERRERIQLKVYGNWHGVNGNKTNKW